MTEAQALEAIEEFWEAGWELLHPEDPNDPDHVPFTLGNEAATGVALWARVTILHSTRVQTTIGPPGTRRYEVRGRVAVQLFADVDHGDKPLAELADDVRTVLQGKAIAVGSENINLFEAATTPNDTDGRWNQCTVSTAFLYQALG